LATQVFADREVEAGGKFPRSAARSCCGSSCWSRRTSRSPTPARDRSTASGWPSPPVDWTEPRRRPGCPLAGTGV